MYLWGYVYLNSGVTVDEGRGPGPPEFGLQAGMNHLMWTWEPNVTPLQKSVHALDPWTTSPAPSVVFKKRTGNRRDEHGLLWLLLKDS